MALHTGFDRLPWAGEKLRQTAGVNQQFYAAGDASVASDQTLAFERDQHLIDRGRGDAKVAQRLV